ncbi:MAG: hypothetical protein JXP36_11045 [Bacteroidales bacterium]|nr:hypothetical protein [Bacteroidales bacterium]
MRKYFCLILLTLFTILVEAQTNWSANWITEPDCTNELNSWYCLRKDFLVNEIPDSALAKIAIDSKYWLWINGSLVVFEGGLKRIPSPENTYFDELDIAPYLVKGKNNISVLGWYFGKDGFSHFNSGKFGFLFECITPDFKILSDDSWKVIKNPAYQTCPAPFPNFRLPESSIKYDATLDMGDWFDVDYSTENWKIAEVLGACSCVR